MKKEHWIFLRFLFYSFLVFRSSFSWPRCAFSILFPLRTKCLLIANWSLLGGLQWWSASFRLLNFLDKSPNLDIWFLGLKQFFAYFPVIFVVRHWWNTFHSESFCDFNWVNARAVCCYHGVIEALGVHKAGIKQFLSNPLSSIVVMDAESMDVERPWHLEAI